MSRKLRIRLVPLAVAAVLTSTSAPAFAGVIDPAPIGPNQYFYGLVNGQAGQSVIKMACFGPVTPGQTGHPLAGQTVEVRPVPSPSTVDVGYTGSAATAVGVSLGNSASAVTPIVLRYYGVAAAIPTSLNLPCYGSGVVEFVPAPPSSTSRPAAVKVNFVGQP
ncbi:hypothetical protein N5079_01015 [Planotetraspora sp. A-T 1434]|uniref:hypothetical protein n=1 Tax=Planotetraspora sp. A-T 1434 TaxID=2979219 RepID=UPI0021BFF167|nr:hypothetical protein [Planotetraspora sp. A-T 1434]MCT9928791.1 hypothetical protein [Planotetraspora sp. A-T 1434]